MDCRRDRIFDVAGTAVVHRAGRRAVERCGDDAGFTGAPFRADPASVPRYKLVQTCVILDQSFDDSGIKCPPRDYLS